MSLLCYRFCSDPKPNMQFIFILICLQAAAVAGASWPAVRPEYRVIGDGSSHTVVCSFGAMLTDCRLRVWVTGWVDTTLDFGRGEASAAQNIPYTRDRTLAATARYAGAGLVAGDCGTSLVEVKEGSYVVQCSGRAANGSWASGFGLLRSELSRSIASTTSTPRFIVASAGSDVSLTVNTEDQRAVDRCLIHTHSAGWLQVDRGRAPPAGSRYRLQGAGMQGGRCDFTLANVARADGGVWRWYGYQDGAISNQLTVVAVAAAPQGGPDLHVSDASNLRAGGVLHATCSVPASVPPGNLTWLLGGEIVRQDSFIEPLDGDVAASMPWEPRQVRQTLTRLLTASDDGNKLECRLEHGAMSDVRTASVTIRVLPSISQECGRRGMLAARQLSVGGKEAGFAEFPWHVAVFQAVFRKDQTVTYQNVCGATLVSPTFLVSAAHCFWSKQLHQLMNATLYKVVAGKHTPYWDVVERGEQRRDLKRIHLPEIFLGHLKGLESDIAALELATPVRPSLAVGVVCMDWTHTTRYRHYARAGDNGTVPGWGITEDNTQAATLRYVDLPFVPRATCLHAMPFDFLVYITLDKLCGGFVNRSTGVCIGDSGGGYVFPQRRDDGVETYFLRGIVSSQPLGTLSCQTELPSTFTSVAAHAEWLHGVVVGDDD